MKFLKKRTFKNLVNNTFSDKNIPKSTTNNIIKRVIIVLIAFAVVSSIASYTLVICKENDIRKLHIETSYVKRENLDMKTEVYFSKGLYNVENKASSISYLHKPVKILEVVGKQNKIDINLDEYRKKPVERVVNGY